MNPSPNTNPTLPLEQLLQRPDLWRGQGRRLAPPPVLDSGHTSLNGALLGGGWPLGSLIELCPATRSNQALGLCGWGEWQLLLPALRQGRGQLVLLNPPAMPFAQGLLQQGLDLDRLLVVQASDRADFLAAFAELARTPGCDQLLAWQPPQALNYTQLRKCQLAADESLGLRLLLRPASALAHNSPARLRLALSLARQHVQVQIHKQLGVLGVAPAPITLELPASWQPLLPHRLLDQQQPQLPGHTRGTSQFGRILPLKRSRR